VTGRQYWTDPGAFAIGRRPGRSLVDRFDSLADLDAGNRTNRMDLAGDWDFEWVDGLVGFDGHAAAAAGPRGAGRIPVPSLWQLEGHGVPIYLANTYPPAIDRRHIPRIDQSRNEAGVYGRTFTLPAGWAGRRVSLVFEGVKAGLLVYLNGREVGYSQGSFTPAEFDLIDHLRPGENRLTAVVWRYTDGTYLEDQDMWFLSGIFRPVYLLAEPEVSMTDIWVRTDLDPASGSGTMLAEAMVANASGRPARAEVDLLLRGPGETDRRPAGTAVLDLPATGEAVARIEVGVPDAAPWTAETPHLYEVVALLRTGGGPSQVLRVRTGIRTIRIAEGRLLVNGRPIIFHGVNRHDFDPDHGWVVPEHRYREDLLAAKRLNINAIRCAHYPNPQQLYDLCDELGLYVIDECDLETHGVRRRNVPGDNPVWTAAVVDRMERMVLADRNHPSIVMWSLGNEAGPGGPGGGNLARMRAAADALDGTRPYHYEGDHQPGVSDVVSRMYATADQMAALGRKEQITPGRLSAVTNRFFTDDKPIGPELIGDRPVMLCEFAHAMGNSLGNFAEYLEVFHGYPNQLGGFIWDFADQSIRRVGPDGIPRWHYGGDFGERPNHRYFCNNGILGPDRVEHPSAREVFWGYRPLAVEAVDSAAGSYAVASRLSFTRGAQFDAVVEVRRDGELARTVALGPVDVGPGERVDVHVPEAAVRADDTAEVVVRFVFLRRAATAWAAAGEPVAFDEFVVNAPPRPAPAPAPSPPGGLRSTGRDTARSALLTGADGVRLVGRASSLAGRPGALGAAAARWADLGAQGLAQATRRRPVPRDSSPGRWSVGWDGAGKPAGITHREDPGGCTVTARGARFTIDRATGHLVSWQIAGPDGRPLDVLVAPLRPNYWRALTDNDRGYGNIDARLQQVLVDTSWRDLTVRVVDAQLRSSREALEVCLQLDSPLFGDGLLSYRFREDGSVEVHHGLVPDRDMYRLGVTTRLPQADSVRWYGKGPHENYVDRNHGAFTAVHQLPLADLPHRYVRPQENGNRTEVRWVETIGRHTVLRAEDLTGEHLGFTAWPWTQEALDAAEHDHELLAGPEVTLNLDRRQRGVGGDLPGMAALLPAYTIPSGRRHELRMRLSARVSG
jgi:beta-galactosidase